LQREFQFELVAEEIADRVANRFGLLPGTRETEQEIVGVPDIVEASKARIEEVHARQPTQLAEEVGGLGMVASLPSLVSLPGDAPVILRDLPLLASRMIGNEDGFDVRVQLVQVDVGQERAEDTPLGRAAEGFGPFPVLHISCFE